MQIRRLSIRFCVLFSLFSLFAALSAFVSFSVSISLDECEALNLPVLIIETDGAKKIKSREKYLDASYTLISKRDENTIGTTKSGKAKIRGRGNTTWVTRELFKKPYLLKLDEENSLLGLPNARKWVLMANTADKTQLRNFYAEHLARTVWNSLPWSPESRYISLFVNGKYEGLYALTEKIEAATGRVPIHEEDGSFVFDVNLRMNKDWNFRSERGVPFSIRTNLKNLSDEEFLRRQDIIQNAENLLFSSESGFSPELWQIFDKDSFIDWYLINELTKNHDASFKSSCYLYYDALKKKIFMGPVWDFDLSCGNVCWDDCEKTEGFWIKDAPWYQKFFEDEEFVASLCERWSEKQKDLEDSIEWIKTTGKMLSPAIQLNDAVWKNIGHRQWPHAPGWKNRKTYESEIDYMTNWLEARIRWMNDALKGLQDGTQK